MERHWRSDSWSEFGWRLDTGDCRGEDRQVIGEVERGCLLSLGLSLHPLYLIDVDEALCGYVQFKSYITYKKPKHIFREKVFKEVSHSQHICLRTLTSANMLYRDLLKQTSKMLEWLIQKSNIIVKMYLLRTIPSNVHFHIHWCDHWLLTNIQCVLVRRRLHRVSVCNCWSRDTGIDVDYSWRSY